MAGRLAGKVAFITGAASGMGRAGALLFLREGAAVGGFDLDPAGLESLVADAGDLADRLVTLAGDVTQEADVAAAIEATWAHFGRLDVLYPNAGVLWRDRDRSVIETDFADWHRVLDINLGGVFLTCKYGIPRLRASGGGSIVLVGSICALAGTTPAQDAYNSTKGAIVALSRSLAIQFAPDKIRCNVVHPGMIATAMQAQKMQDDSWVASVESGIPLGRMGTAEEVVRVALFLASDDASYVTGTEIAADGGYTAQ
jgi:NAD(P)-dependent dehydrogenase (short-subunit alcohol dehydrogenase family)